MPFFVVWGAFMSSITHTHLHFFWKPFLLEIPSTFLRKFSYGTEYVVGFVNIQAKIATLSNNCAKNLYYLVRTGFLSNLKGTKI